MSVLSPAQVRQIIAEIPDNFEVKKHCNHMKAESTETQFTPEDVQAYFQTMFIGAFRTGELCGTQYPSDKSKNTGHTLEIKKTIYTPDLNNQVETDTLRQTIYIQNLRQGKEAIPGYKELLQIKEPIIIISVQTEKRKDNYIRHVALPLNPELEPFSQPVYDYFQQRKKELIFPINRMQAYRLAHKIFYDTAKQKQYKYKIRPYRKDKIENGKVVKKLNSKGELKAERITITPDPKDFGDHAVRHSSIEEKKKIGIRGHVLIAFIGWSPQRTETLEEVYDQNDPFTTCRTYLPYLITNNQTTII
jgi:hypothetical protein